MPDVARDLKKFEAAFAKLDKAVDSLVRASTEPSAVQARDPRVFQVIARRALEEVRPLARTMLRQNLAKSGIQENSGKLSKAIDSVIVGGKFDLNKPWRIYIIFPRDEEDYVNKTGAKSNPYKVWASLGHGWVRTGKGATKPKAKALAGAKRRAMEKGKESFKSKGSTYTVVPARPFFLLDEGQKAELSAAFVQAFNAQYRQAQKMR